MHIPGSNSVKLIELPMRRLGILLSLAASLYGGEYAVFSGGSRLRVDRHERSGSRVVLITGDSRMEVDASQVLGFEPDDYIPPPPAPLAQPDPVPPPAQPTVPELADLAADRYGLPRELVRAVITVESNWDPKATSPKGAKGLMQLMPATARELGADPLDPPSSIDAGVRYLRDLLLKYERGLWRALAAYNAGPDAVDRYGGVPPYPETIDYVVRVVKLMNLPTKQAAPPASPGGQP